MFDENAFSLDAFDQGSWLFMLDAPYFDLSGKQRIYVRSVLESAYTITEVEQIIATAAVNQISVLDSITSLRIDPAPAIKAAKEIRNKALQAIEVENHGVNAMTKHQSISILTKAECVYVTQIKKVSAEAKRRKPRTIEISGNNLIAGE